MLDRLFPREGTEFFEFFERHAQKTLEAAELLRKMLVDPRDAEAQAQRIQAIEREGDDITHSTIDALRRVFLAPIEPGDIHQLISSLDDILDLIDSTAERLWLYEIREIEPEVHGLADVLVRAVATVRKAVTQLRNLREQDGILESCKEIGNYEREGDQLVRHAMARLFEEERDPIHVMVWKEMYRFLEDAIDRCEDVANVLEGVALEYA